MAHRTFPALSAFQIIFVFSFLSLNTLIHNESFLAIGFQFSHVVQPSKTGVCAFSSCTSCQNRDQVSSSARFRPCHKPKRIRYGLQSKMGDVTICSRHILLSKSGDSDGSDKNNIPGGAGAVGGELVSALARLDKKWELARRSGERSKIGEWTILDVSRDEKNWEDEEYTFGTSSSKSAEIVYLLEPASGASPSCAIFFLGGAVLGQFPHISYSAFLQRLATKMNASVVAIPYEIGLDHFGIAQRAVNRMKQAVIKCEDSRGYPSSLPKYAIGHSLGAKLHSIGIAATGIGEELSGAGFISYNNFGFADTIKMAGSFARELQAERAGQSGFGVGSPMPFDAIIDFAEMAVSAVGLEFSPSPTDTDRILKSKFNEEILRKTRMFAFDDDDLDSTNRFLECFDGDFNGEQSVSYLPGTHLTPVYLKLGLDDLPGEARDIANQVSGGFQNASFGNEEALDSLVDEVSSWMLGNSPGATRAGQKVISGSVDAEIEE